MHITIVAGYASVCGKAMLGTQFKSSDAVLAYAEVARVQRRSVTCVECLAAWEPETQFL